MAKFKNIFTETCEFEFEGVKHQFYGVTEIEDKKLIEFLKQAPDFVLVEEKKEEKPKK